MNKLNVPQLRFKGFEGEWEEKNIEDLCTMQAGKFISASEIKDNYSEDLFPCYGGNGLRGYTSSFNYDGNYSLIGRQGALCGNITFAKNKFYATEHAIVVNVNQNIDKNWMYYILNIKNLNQYATGQAQPGLSVQNIKKVNVTITNSLPEQQKIASFLSAIDEKIQQLSRKKELLEQYKKGVMQQLFSGKLRFKDENGKDYPDWEEKRLGDFKNLVHGDGDWILSENIDAGEKYSIIQLGNIGFGKFINKPMKTLSEKNFKVIKGTLIENGDLLINRMVDVNLNACVFKFTGLYVTSVDVCWIRAGSNINNVFFSNLILTEKYQKKLLSLSSGSGRVRISKKNFFDKFYFELPCLEEQQKIANFLSSIDAKIENTKDELEKIQLFKKGLLQKMFV
ncbi:restriction endonuclease subunit S [Flavobacterium polysaccharolyticum]|uniref:Restriction endonuclease subunit S n=1 Tax=Flavobacterium polysaccharolyticum TaxID=3133148 RepID=A0ABU9NSX5_9FLAO